MSDCDQVKRLFASRIKSGEGILHPSWLTKHPSGDVVAGLRALGFRPEFPDTRKSPVPFRRYFDRQKKRTLIVEPWAYECLGRCPELANTRKKRMVQYHAELQRRLAGDVEVSADAAIAPGVAADVLCTAWLARGPAVEVRSGRQRTFWSWEATSFAIIDGIHPSPMSQHRAHNALRHAVRFGPELKRRDARPSSAAIGRMKRRLVR